MYFSSQNIQRLTVDAIGADFFPQLASAGIFIFSTALLIKGLKTGRELKKMEQKELNTSQKDSTPSFSKEQAIPVLATMGLIIVYLLLLREIGFLIMTTIYLVLQMYVLAKPAQRNLPLFLVIAVVVAGVVYYVFRYFFNLMLPTGILG